MTAVQSNVLRGSYTAASASSQKTTKLPSIFDFLAQESLFASMKPGIRSALKLFLHYFPRRFTFAEKHFEELYLLFHLLLENHYLMKFSASFSENLYGMKRVPLRASLSRIRSLIFLVVFPYVYDKCEKFRERLQFEGNAAQHNKSWHRRLFLRFYPHLKALCLLLSLLFQIAYTFSLSSVPSPLLFFAKCRLEKLTAEDISKFKANGGKQMQSSQMTSISTRLFRFFLSFPSMFGRFLSLALFLVQFIEYCYSDELGSRFGQALAGQQIRIPEHPYNFLPTEQQVLCMEVDKCPICRRSRTDDTVLSVSGYVFCHVCIYNYVRLEGSCPITSIPATTKELVKIYQ